MTPSPGYASVIVSPSSASPLRLDHHADRQAVRPREREVALVVRGTAMIAPVPYSIST